MRQEHHHQGSSGSINNHYVVQKQSDLNVNPTHNINSYDNSKNSSMKPSTLSHKSNKAIILNNNNNYIKQTIQPDMQQQLAHAK